MKIKFYLFKIGLLSTLCLYQNTFAQDNQPDINPNNRILFSKWTTGGGQVVDLTECHFDNQINEDLYTCFVTVTRVSTLTRTKTICREKFIFSKFDNKYRIPGSNCAADLIGSVGRYVINDNILTITGYYLSGNGWLWDRCGPRDLKFKFSGMS